MLNSKIGIINYLVVLVVSRNIHIFKIFYKFEILIFKYT